MELSQRLRKVADRVPEGAVLADIGTDHGRLPVWLMEQGRISEAFACDVRPGPLSRARELILEQGLSDRIHPVLSDGMEALEPGKITAVTIAGMGGRLTARILLADRERKPGILCGLTDLILQPQSDLDAVREYLHRTGFVIVQEEMVFEEGKYYPMMKAVHGENTDDRKIWFLYGRLLLENRHPVLESYLQKEYDSCCKLLEKLSKTATEVASRRCEELLEKKHLIEEALAFYREDT